MWYDVRMSTTTIMTADELLELPSGMGKRYELVAGELRTMSPSGWQHGLVVGNMHTLLGQFIRQRKLGLFFGAETGFRLARNPDTVRAPDFAFIKKSNVPAQEPSEAFWPGPPDLAVEVLSPGDRTGEVDEKIAAWLAAGVAAVWVVDPKLETVTTYESATRVHVWTAGDELNGGLVLPGFSCPVDEMFH
jgi:Uma2 family endonuclease